jgi:hypothetical protein
LPNAERRPAPGASMLRSRLPQNAPHSSNTSTSGWGA